VLLVVIRNFISYFSNSPSVHQACKNIKRKLPTRGGASFRKENESTVTLLLLLVRVNLTYLRCLPFCADLWKKPTIDDHHTLKSMNLVMI
jgi:hypothetical protein